MADGFGEREKGFESKWAHDEDLRFKVMARRNKLVGLWAAGLLGLTGDEAEAYAGTVVMSDFQEIGDNDVFMKLKGDLAHTGTEDRDIRAKMDGFLSEAADQVTKA
ncbi:MAG TPA: DUF1476 domain-containing protein [Rhizomicrobium sp.]|jgi:hypothetical protein